MGTNAEHKSAGVHTPTAFRQPASHRLIPARVLAKAVHNENRGSVHGSGSPGSTVEPTPRRRLYMLLTPAKENRYHEVNSQRQWFLAASSRNPKIIAERLDRETYSGSALLSDLITHFKNLVEVGHTANSRAPEIGRNASFKAQPPDIVRQDEASSFNVALNRR